MGLADSLEMGIWEERSLERRRQYEVGEQEPGIRGKIRRLGPSSERDSRATPLLHNGKGMLQVVFAVCIFHFTCFNYYTNIIKIRKISCPTCQLFPFVYSLLILSQMQTYIYILSAVG